MTGKEQARIAEDDIDLDRVIVDPSYRRRVIEQLRVEAERRTKPPLALTEPVGRDD